MLQTGSPTESEGLGFRMLHFCLKPQPDSDACFPEQSEERGLLTCLFGIRRNDPFCATAKKKPKPFNPAALRAWNRGGDTGPV